MARYLAIQAQGWGKVPETVHKIRVWAGGASPHWVDIRIASVWDGHRWGVAWKLSTSQASHAVKPPAHETVYHTATVTANIVRTTAHWAIPSGRHVSHQSLRYATGTARNLHWHTVTLSTRDRSKSGLIAGPYHATVTYTYY